MSNYDFLPDAHDENHFSFMLFIINDSFVDLLYALNILNANYQKLDKGKKEIHVKIRWVNWEKWVYNSMHV